MHRFVRRARRFFWWCAAADAAILDHPDTPRSDGIKYAAVGALVCLTTVVAVCGWTHNAATLMAGREFGLLAALGLGLLMGAVVFCIERVLVVSVRQDARLPAKIAAFAWRGVIAALAAAMVTTPFALAYFHNGILARLDEEKLALMSEKRRAVEDVYRLNDKGAVVAALNRELDENRDRRDRLPADVLALSAAADQCGREHDALLRALLPKIAAAGRDHAALLREIADRPKAAAYLRPRLSALAAQIAAWKSSLAKKVKACRRASDRFTAGRQDYYTRLDQERQDETARKQEAQRTLAAAQADAGVAIARSDAVVVAATAPDLSGCLRALGQMAQRDPLVLIVLLIAYAFFYLIEMMPILAKLVMRTIHDVRISAAYRRLSATIAADAAIAEADAAMRCEIAKAELIGVETLVRQGGGEVIAELAKARVQVETAKAEAAIPFAKVAALIESFERTQARADDVADRYAGRPELTAHIEAVREALSNAMRMAAASHAP